MSIAAVFLFAQAATPTQPPPPVVRVVSPPVVAPPPPPVVVAPPAPPPPIYTTPAPHPRSATPLGNPGYWVTTSDYPPRALREERGGVVAFRLTLDAAGLVSGCIITSSSGSPDLDAVTCSLVTQRARFRPATDAKGKNVEGTFSNRVRWVIPEDTQPNPFINPDGRFLAAEVTYQFFIEPDGSTSDCVLITNDTAETLEQPEGPCVTTKPFKPFLDAKGMPVRKRVSVTVKTTVVDPPKP
jgi:periplasmic protein TonB